MTAIQTGLRVSGLVNFRIDDVRFEADASVKVIGKRREQRVAPLTPETVRVLRVWLSERQGHGYEPLFPTRQGRPLTTKAVPWLLYKPPDQLIAFLESV